MISLLTYNVNPETNAYLKSKSNQRIPIKQRGISKEA